MQHEWKRIPLLTKVLWGLWIVCLLVIYYWPGDLKEGRVREQLLALGALFGVLSLSCWFVTLRQIARHFAPGTAEEEERTRRVARGLGVMVSLAGLGLVIGAAIGGDNISNAAALSLLGLGSLSLLLGCIPVFRMTPGWLKEGRGVLALEKALLVFGCGFGVFAAFIGGCISPKGLDDPPRVLVALVLGVLAVAATVLGLRPPRTQTATCDDGSVPPHT